MSKPSESPKMKRIETTSRRSSLTSPTASSKAKELANRAARNTNPQKSIVVKVVTAASLKAAEAKKVSSTTTKVSNVTPAPSDPAPTRKVQSKRPLDDAEDDIYAYYAKKRQRMEDMLNNSKAPTLSSVKPSVVAKPVIATSKAKPIPSSSSSSSIKSLEPAAKRRATEQAVRTLATSKTPSTSIKKP